MLQFQNILLIRTDRIGDVVLTTPLITILHREFPRSKIFFLTREYTAPLLKHYEFLEEIIIYQPESEHRGFNGHLKLGKILKEKKIDIAFLFYPLPGLALALFMAEIPFRVGTGYRWFSFLLNYRIYEHRKYGKKHELEYNLSLIQKFIKKVPNSGEIQFQFRIDEHLKKLQNNALRKLQITGDYIIIHPGSGGSAPNLPAEAFARIVKYLLQQTQYFIILAGDHSEAKLLQMISGNMKNEKLRQVTGDWDLETYAAVISGARMFISNSTGPLHIARAMEIPLLAFYCPAIPCSPERWGPYNKLDSVIMPRIEPCKSCNQAKCPHGNCLALISWEMIQPLLDKKLKKNT
jgi:ADP-heptose:LPS heptosyltransferase